MAYGTGTAEIDFGAFPGANEASVVVSEPTISAATKVEAWIMGDDTTDSQTMAMLVSMIEHKRRKDEEEALIAILMTL